MFLWGKTNAPKCTQATNHGPLQRPPFNSHFRATELRFGTTWGFVVSQKHQGTQKSRPMRIQSEKFASPARVCFARGDFVLSSSWFEVRKNCFREWTPPQKNLLCLVVMSDTRFFSHAAKSSLWCNTQCDNGGGYYCLSFMPSCSQWENASSRNIRNKPQFPQRKRGSRRKIAGKTCSSPLTRHTNTQKQTNGPGRKAKHPHRERAVNPSLKGVICAAAQTTNNRGKESASCLWFFGRWRFESRIAF